MTGGGRPRRPGQNGVPLVDSERLTVGSLRNGWKRVRRFKRIQEARSGHANRRGSSTSRGRSEIAPNEEQRVRYRDNVYGASPARIRAAVRRGFAREQGMANRTKNNTAFTSSRMMYGKSARSRGVITPNPCCHTRRRRGASRPSPPRPRGWRDRVCLRCLSIIHDLRAWREL